MAFFDEMVAKAVELLDHLTKPHQREGNHEPSYLLHPKLINQAKALQFVFAKKAGLVVGVSTGHGFTITKLRTFSDGSTSWSAPCFLTATSLSLGATIGKQDTSALSVVLSDKAAQAIQSRGSTGPALAAEASFTLSEKWSSAHASLDSLLLEDVVWLGLSDGLLVDLSAAVGALHVSTKQNEEVYGPGVGPMEILGGGSKPVSAPPAFGDVYDKLNEVIESVN